MSFQEETYYKIEAYLSGELDAVEKEAFEKELSTDDLLNAEVEKHKIANALIAEQRLLSVKNILQEERVKDSGSGNSFNPVGLVIVAAVAIGIGTSVWMLKNDINASSDDASQNTSGIVKSENSVEQAKMNALKKESEQNVPVEDIGFHKQQIQQMEEHLHTDEKGVLYIDSSYIHTRADIKAQMNDQNVPQTPMPNVAESASVDPCAHVSVQASIKPSPSCSHEPNGNILVLNMNGGTKPYAFSVVSNSNESVVNGQLTKGVYKVIVSDSKGCSHTYSDIVIAEKDCPVDYSFNPFYGNEEWEIAPQDIDRELEIYDKGGVLYFKKHIPGSTSYKWNGMGTGNQILPGYYIFVMKYANGTVQKGSVTIVQ